MIGAFFRYGGPVVAGGAIGSALTSYWRSQLSQEYIVQQELSRASESEDPLKALRKLAKIFERQVVQDLDVDGIEGMTKAKKGVNLLMQATKRISPEAKFSWPGTYRSLYGEMKKNPLAYLQGMTYHQLTPVPVTIKLSPDKCEEVRPKPLSGGKRM